MARAHPYRAYDDNLIDLLILLGINPFRFTAADISAAFEDPEVCHAAGPEDYHRSWNRKLDALAEATATLLENPQRLEIRCDRDRLSEWDEKSTWATLVRKVAQLSRKDRASRSKVGITSDPRDRASRDDYVGTYDQMILLWTSWSESDVRDIEKALTEKFGDALDNEVMGGAGSLGSPPHHVYLVRKHPKKRKRA